MSVRIMAMVWDCEALPHKHRLMMLALADHAGDDGLAWPSVTTLAKKCGIHERNAQKQLRTLEEDGWIVVAKSKGGRAKSGEKSRNNHYCLNLGALFDGARSTSGATPNPGASATPNPGASATPNPGASATRTINTTINQPSTDKPAREARRRRGLSRTTNSVPTRSPDRNQRNSHHDRNTPTPPE